jgi:8-oxo-dGTP diphosphatase
MSVPYIHHSDKSPRTTSRGIIVFNNKILLMERWRDGLHYFSIPGGGVEGDELHEEAVIREIKEETSIIVIPKRLLYKMHDSVGNKHLVYLCNYVEGKARLSKNSEEAKLGPNNRFKPVWVPINLVENLPFLYWEPIQELLVEDLAKGFSKKVKITAA